MNTQSPILLSVDFEKRMGGFTLQSSFEVGQNPFALLGASGSGKSVTLKCIAGIMTPDRGRIVLNGRILYDSEKKINLRPQERHVGYMFQDYALFPNMTVVENVMAGMGRHARAEDALPYLRKCRVEEFRDRNVTELSGGQKQRVAMARILAQKPEAILLDEPFSALDTFLKFQMEEEMSSFLQETQVPVIFVTHSRDEVLHLCKEVTCLVHGTTGTTKSVYDFFHFPETSSEARLSGCRNISRAVRIDDHTLKALDWGCTFRLKKEVPEGTGAVGLRAHFMYPNKTPDLDLELPIASAREINDPFEHRVLIHALPDGAVIEYLAARSKHDHFEVPRKLYFSSHDLMLLSR